MMNDYDLDTLHWYALHTRSRHEKFINDQLAHRGIESFLPIRRLKRRWSDRTKIIDEPLFKGYIFVKTNLQNKRDVLSVKGAVKFVSAGSQPIALPEKDILSIKTIVEQEIELDRYPYLNEGDRVYIKKGPLKGIEGYIIRKSPKNCQLVISIDAIMQSASIKVDASMVEKTY